MHNQPDLVSRINIPPRSLLLFIIQRPESIAITFSNNREVSFLVQKHSSAVSENVTLSWGWLSVDIYPTYAISENSFLQIVVASNIPAEIPPCKFILMRICIDATLKESSKGDVIKAKDTLMKKVPYLHILLFVTTFFSTLCAGALQKGINIFDSPRKIIDGLPFAGTLMIILTIHELSHYIASKRRHVTATLPYFIPAPSLIGTFGAFIKMKSPIITRSALIDIGASGPIAGFIASLIACIVGLSMSKVVTLAKVDGSLVLGDSLLFSFLSRIILGNLPKSADVLLHPVAFAGWIGFFVTSLNLLPIGQLDGGHIAFAILGDRHRYVSITLVGILAVFGFFAVIGPYGWEGWGIWALLLLLLGIKHPPVLYWETPLDCTRKYIAFVSLLIFIVTFIPTPFKI